MVKSLAILLITNVLKNKLMQKEPLVTGTLNSIAYMTLFKEFLTVLRAVSKKLVIAFPFCIFLGVLTSFVYLDIANLLDHPSVTLKPSFYLNLFLAGVLLLGLYFLFKKTSANKIVVAVRGERLIPLAESSLSSDILISLFDDVLTSFSRGFQEKYKKTPEQTISLAEYKKEKSEENYRKFSDLV